eukprot:2823987-Rhodomonas_salina.2
MALNQANLLSSHTHRGPNKVPFCRPAWQYVQWTALEIWGKGQGGMFCEDVSQEQDRVESDMPGKVRPPAFSLRPGAY